MEAQPTTFVKNYQRDHGHYLSPCVLSLSSTRDHNVYSTPSPTMAHDKEIKTKKSGYRWFFPSLRLAIVKLPFQI